MTTLLDILATDFAVFAAQVEAFVDAVAPLVGAWLLFIGLALIAGST